MATAAIERPQCRTSPSAHQALKQHFAEHPEDKLHHPHKWDVSRSDIYAENTWHPIFREMREAGPLHYIDDSPFGPYWAVVGHKAIQHIEALPDTFSSSWEHGGITILERLTDEQLAERGLDERRELPMFIAMDRPQHTGQRRTVAPKFTPSGMAEMEGEIRQRTGELLDSLPRGEVFDWVDTVSIELTMNHKFVPVVRIVNCVDNNVVSDNRLTRSGSRNFCCGSCLTHLYHFDACLATRNDTIDVFP